MKRIKIGIISFVALFAISIMLGIGLFESHAANSKTIEEVKAWLDYEINEFAPQIHGRGECVDFCNYYLNNCWETPSIGGNANTWRCPQGWTPVNINGNPDNFQMGDLIVEDYSPYGHVCVYYGKENGKHYVVDQNSDVRYPKKHVWSTPLSQTTYAYRPPLNDSVINLGEDFYANIAAAGSGNWSFIENNGNNVCICTIGNDYTNTSQRWHFIRQSDGSYRIINEYNGIYLNADAMGPAGSNVSVSDYMDWDGQKWYIIKNGNWYSIVTKYNPELYLDVKNSDYSSGNNIGIWTKNGAEAQLFDIYKYDTAQYPSVENLGDDFYANIAAAGSGNWSFIENNGNNVCICTTGNDYSNTSQQWHFIRQSDGSYRIINENDGKYLNADAMGSAGTNVSVYDYMDWNGQKWYIIKNGSWYNIATKYNLGLYLDVKNSDYSLGNNIGIWTKNGAEAQLFDIYKYSGRPYTVTYNANNGIGAPSAQVKIHGRDLTLSTTKPTRTGFTFQGWNTKEDGTGTVYLSGGTYKENANLTLYAQWKENTCAHSLNKIEEVEPTCTKDGNRAYWKCSKCGKLFSDENGNNEITWDAIMLPMTNHINGTTVKENEVSATCEKGGSYDLVAYCQNCGIEMNRVKYTTEALGHTFGDWVVTKEATIDEEGLKEKVCATCGNHVTETIPKVVPSDGWIKDSSGTWYYYTNGIKATGWKQVSRTWYLFDNSGAMLTGWQKVNGTWYYMNASGAMATGWVKDGNTWYYMNSSGAMVTGWQKVNGTWYFFKSSGAMAANEWVRGYYWISASGAWTYQPVGSWKKDNIGWWFGDTSGWYAKNTTQMIDGILYTFNAAGYWVG